MQVRLTSGPKRHALEMMRSKIEQQNERVVATRQRHAVAKQAFMLLDEELKREEEAKERLCSELNMLIQQSAELQVRAGWGWWARVPLPGCRWTQARLPGTDASNVRPRCQRFHSSFQSRELCALSLLVHLPVLD